MDEKIVDECDVVAQLSELDKEALGEVAGQLGEMNEPKLCIKWMLKRENRDTSYFRDSDVVFQSFLDKTKENHCIDI